MARPQITTATQSVSVEVEGKTYPGSFTVSGGSFVSIIWINQTRWSCVTRLR